MEVERLSEVMRHLPRGLEDGDTDACDRAASRAFNRLAKLIRTDEARSKELRLLKRWLKGDLCNQPGGAKAPSRHLALLSVEYVIDDGAKLQSRGDALLWDPVNKRLVVLELKRLQATAPIAHRAKKLAYVKRQATELVRRILSWGRHLRYIDGEDGGGLLARCTNVMGATIVADERNGIVTCSFADADCQQKESLELPGIEPGTLLSLSNVKTGE